MYGARNVELVPFDPPAFSTLADAKQVLGISGAEHDATLTRYLVAAAVQAEAFCGTIFAQRTVTETLILRDAVDDLVLAHSPVISVSSVTFETDETDIKSQFECFKRAGILRRSDASPIEKGKYVITYLAGYAAIPATVVEASTFIVRDMYNSKGRVVGVTRESVPDVADVTYGTSGMVRGEGGGPVSVEVAALLEPYRRRFAP